LETLAELESDPAELKAKALAEENKTLLSKLDSMTLPNLKKELKNRKLSEKGKKEEMIA
jgi:spermidine/putrescine-binding protein